MRQGWRDREDGSRERWAIVGDCESRVMGYEDNPEAAAKAFGFDLSRPWSHSPYGCFRRGFILRQPAMICLLEIELHDRKRGKAEASRAKGESNPAGAGA